MEVAAVVVMKEGRDEIDRRRSWQLCGCFEQYLLHRRYDGPGVVGLGALGAWSSVVVPSRWSGLAGDASYPWRSIQLALTANDCAYWQVTVWYGVAEHQLGRYCRYCR